jgi:hypothetical protein
MKKLALSRQCIGMGKIPRYYDPQRSGLEPNMKKIIPASAISGIAALLVFANAPSAFAKPQKKPAGSEQGNPDPLVNAAMKNMESGVWSVNGTVTAKKTIKLQGLLAGEDFDLAMEPA